MPTEFGPLIKRAVDLVGSSAVISVHCHNDLGLAVANTLTAIMAGARQVEVTINGLGERAGNAALEEVVMALQTRSAALGGHTTGVVSEQIAPTSRLVSYLTGFVIQPNKAIVGRNAFAHESGIHQDGVLKNPLNFEIMTPQSVGLAGNRLTVGKLSGRRGLQGKLRDLGFDVDPAALDVIYRAAIALADVKKEVTDADLVALVGQQAAGTPLEVHAPVTLEGWSVTSSHGETSQGHVSLALHGINHTAEGTGNGPVDALFGAVDAAVEPVLGWHPRLVDYEIRAVSGGEDAQGQVTVRARRSSDTEGRGETVTGHGLSTNIIEASLEAYVHALEKLRRGAAGARAPGGHTMTAGDPGTWRVTAIPGDGIGPEVVAAARRVLDAVGEADRVPHRVVRDPHGWRGHRCVWRAHPGRGPGAVRRVRRGAPGRRRRPPVGRAGCGGPTRAGAASAAQAAGAVRQPASRGRRARAHRGIAAPPRPGRGRGHAHRPGAHRRALLRGAS